MDRTETLERVSRLGATAQRPVLSTTQVEGIVDGYALYDADGRQPTHPDWTPTYDWAGATAEVWSTKASLVAGDYNFTADDLKADKGEVLAHMLAMEAKYAALAVSPAGGASGAPKTGGAASTLEVAGTNGPYSVVDKVARLVIP